MFADLSPYICTFANCDMELAKFPTRVAWAEHEFSEHRVIRWWECFECTKKCHSEIEWKEHLECRHKRTFIGAKYHVAEKMALKKRAKAAATEECPLCQVTLERSRREFVKHVGKHMEEIALAALPREVDDESDAHSISVVAESSSISSSVGKSHFLEIVLNKRTPKAIKVIEAVEAMEANETDETNEVNETTEAKEVRETQDINSTSIAAKSSSFHTSRMLRDDGEQFNQNFRDFWANDQSDARFTDIGTNIDLGTYPIPTINIEPSVDFTGQWADLPVNEEGRTARKARKARNVMTRRRSSRLENYEESNEDSTNTPIPISLPRDQDGKSDFTSLVEAKEVRNASDAWRARQDAVYPIKGKETKEAKAARLRFVSRGSCESCHSMHRRVRKDHSRRTKKKIICSPTHSAYTYMTKI